MGCQHLWMLPLLLTVARAQEGPVDKLPARVTGPGPAGTVLVDRGERDNVRVGDEVYLYPSGGGLLRGRVTEVTERSAVVDLGGQAPLPAPGSRGQVLIPRTRAAAGQAPAVPPPASRPNPEFRNPDQEFKPGMPLLAQVRAQDPKERAPRITGRDYLISSVGHTAGQGFGNSFFRAGTDLRFDNTFGEGETMRINPELAWRNESNDQEGFDLILRRVSYARGGTRFAADRWEFGRFLQHGLPELGVLDGVEWGHRLDGGNRIGASLGFMPRPDDDFNSFEDLQVAGYYQWVSDVQETVVVTGGVQKSFHHRHSDRDLLLGKLRWLPGDGWDLSATAWVDLYFGDDQLKGSGLELTQALVALSRSWADGDRVDLTYARLLYPELLRREFLPVDPNQVQDDHLDQLRLSGVSGAYHGLVAAWNDEDRPGGSVEAGTWTSDLGLDHSRADLTAFVTRARFAWVMGARVSYGRVLGDCRWDVLYEIANHHMDGFPASQDDTLQHRLRGSVGFRVGRGWDVSLHGEGSLFDQDLSAFVGIAIQRSY